MVAEQEKNSNVWVEVIDVSNLKQKVIEDNPELKGFQGLVLKRIHKSKIGISYEKIEGGFAEFLRAKLQTCPNIPKFIEMGKEKFNC